MSRVVVFDYGSGNVRSAVRALEHVGAEVELTGDRATALAADGLFVPGVGNFHACMAGLRAADGPLVIDLRLAGGRPVLGRLRRHAGAVRRLATSPAARPTEGLGEWPGDGVPAAGRRGAAHGLVRRRRRRRARRLFAGVESERFYFVHSYAVQAWTLEEPAAPSPPWRPRSPGPTTAAGSSPPSRTARSRPRSSTPRSPGTPACPSSRTG